MWKRVEGRWSAKYLGCRLCEGLQKQARFGREPIEHSRYLVIGLTFQSHGCRYIAIKCGTGLSAVVDGPLVVATLI